MKKELFEDILAIRDIDAICRAMVDIAFDACTDFKWFEEKCVMLLLMDPDKDVRGLAATCLGHVARQTGELTSGTVKALQALKDDLVVGGRVQDALDDWNLFAQPRK